VFCSLQSSGFGVVVAADLWWRCCGVEVFLPEVSLAPAAAPVVKGSVAAAVLYGGGGGGGDGLVGFMCRFRWQLVVTYLRRVWWWRLQYDCYGGDENCDVTDMEVSRCFFCVFTVDLL
jgi:hypothetical protein